MGEFVRFVTAWTLTMVALMVWGFLCLLLAVAPFAALWWVIR